LLKKFVNKKPKHNMACSYSPNGQISSDRQFTTAVRSKILIGCDLRVNDIVANTAVIGGIPVPSQVVFSSRAEAEAARIPPLVEEITVFAGERPLNYVRNTTGETSKTALTTADGEIWMAANGLVSPDHYGWLPTSTNTESNDFVVQALLSGFTDVIFYRGSTYLVNSIDETVTNDLYIHLEGTIKGSDEAGFEDSRLMYIRSSPAKTHSFQMQGGGTVDASNRNYIAGIESGSGMNLGNFDRVYVRGIFFYSADTLAELKGDSGFNPLQCKRVTVSHCWFQGWNDHAIYASGGALTDPNRESTDLIITDCFAKECGTFRAARGYNRVVFSNNICKDVVGMFISAGDGSAGAAVDSAFTIIISDNICETCNGTAINLLYMEALKSATITGNIIYDWGQTGLGGVVGIQLRGVQNSIVANNVIKPVAAVTGCDIGVYVQVGTDPDGVVFQSNNNTVCNNTVQVLETAPGFTNAGIVDMVNNTYIHGNRVLNTTAGYDIQVNDGGVDGSVGSNRVVRYTDNGVGFGGAIPEAPLHSSTSARVSFPDDTASTRYMEIIASASHEFFSYSPTTNGRNLIINATTDNLDTPRTGGDNCVLNLYSLGQGISIDGTDDRVTIDLALVPTFADDAAAGAGGLTAGMIYKTATGGLQIKL
jgi:hypothetical protein